MYPSESPSPQVFFLISVHSTVTPGIPLTSDTLKTSSFDSNFPVEPWSFHYRLTDPPTRPLRPMNPNNASTLRITAAAGTELAGAYSRDTVNHGWVAIQAFFSLKSGLQSENRHPTRGVARSDFRLLPKPLDCCPP